MIGILAASQNMLLRVIQQKHINKTARVIIMIWVIYWRLFKSWRFQGFVQTKSPSRYKNPSLTYEIQTHLCNDYYNNSFLPVQKNCHKTGGPGGAGGCGVVLVGRVGGGGWVSWWEWVGSVLGGVVGGWVGWWGGGWAGGWWGVGGWELVGGWLVGVGEWGWWGVDGGWWGVDGGWWGGWGLVVGASGGWAGLGGRGLVGGEAGFGWRGWGLGGWGLGVAVGFVEVGRDFVTCLKWLCIDLAATFFSSSLAADIVTGSQHDYHNFLFQRVIMFTPV